MNSRVRKAFVSAIIFTTTLNLFPLSLVANAQTTQVALQDGSIVPSQLRGVVGKPVSLNITNRGKKVHNFVIKDFYIFSQNLTPGQSTSVGFTPDKTGAFPFWSDTGGKPEAGMRGTITITSK